MKKSKQSLLWQISKAHLAAPSYIFGTMHIQNQKAFGFKDIVYEKIKACEHFANEFNLEDTDAIAMQAALALPSGKTLHDYISPKKFAKIQSILKKTFGVDIALFIHHTPMLIINLLTNKILSEDHQLALDLHLLAYAQAEGKHITGIETFQEQLDILQKIPLKYQVKSLIDTASNVKKYRQKLLYLASLYQTADIQKIFKATKKNTGQLRKMMIYRRNYIMAERIALLVQKQSLFAAIGAAHLGGQKGVLRLLKRKGFSIKAVK